MPPSRDKAHLRLQRASAREPFRSVIPGRASPPPDRPDPAAHAAHLKGALTRALQSAQATVARRDETLAAGEARVFLTFEMVGQAPQATESLEAG